MLTLKPFRRAAVPLLAVSTADPAGIVRLALSDAKNGTIAPVLVWDCIHGIRPANEQAQAPAGELNNNNDPAIATGNPVEALRALEQLGKGEGRPIVVMLGLADILADVSSGIPARQALWNLRDSITSAGVLVVLVVPMGWRNPFPNDIATAADSLPELSELAALAVKLAADAKAPSPPKALADKCADALIGLSGFAAEQALALSLSKSGIDLPSLWTRKRQQVSQTQGLSIYAGAERFSDLGGLDQAKDLFGRVIRGKRKPGAIVFIDEIEKSIAGSAGDSSGVSQSMLGYLLSYMQDSAATGSIFIGPPGAAKSALAKAVGTEADIPTIQLDLGGLKGSLVGESESRMREALAVVTAVSAGRPLFLATCNSIGNLPPELRRRFTLGTMFFDLPSAEERAAIWPIYIAKFGLEAQALPAADGWTGAEIRQCADLADRLGCTLIDAARFVVPVSKSAAEVIERLRTEASGRYLSAGSTGLYVKPTSAAKARKVTV